MKIRTSMIMIGIMLLLVSGAVVAAASAGDINALNIERLDSLGEINSALGLMQTCFIEAQAKRQLSFELQKTMAAKSGECISRLVTLSQKADLSQDLEKEAYRSLFLKNGDVLRQMLAHNQNTADDLQEEKLDRVQDKDAFFASPEWQQLQYLISIASYWLGWNGYYGALLYPARDATRIDLLEEAISGFTRTVLDFKEQAIVCRSTFGRALCFKELAKYEQALQELQSLSARVSRADSLYTQAGYEKALISHLSGKNDLAAQQLRELNDDIKPGIEAEQLKEKIRKLRTAIALDSAEKKTAAQGADSKQSYREAALELRRMAEADAAQAGALYRYVLEHTAQLADMSDAELGSLGSMAIADWYFDRKQYGPAGERYLRLYSAPDQLIRGHLDDLCFRLAYCHAQRQQWPDALACLETLFQRYPGSSFGGTAACLYYAAAAHTYQTQASESSLARYIKAAECYVKHCPDPRDKNEANFQLGQFYQHKGRTQDALLMFSRISSDSPHYAEAQHASLLSKVDTLQASVEALETLVHNGQGQSDEAARLYREGCKQAEAYQKGQTKARIASGGSEIEAHMALLLARLYLHAPAADARTALHYLQGFEGTFSIKQQPARLHVMAQQLRLECCLQLRMRKEAEQEIAALIGQGAVDKSTWTFLNECADRQYAQAKAAQADNNSAEQYAESALTVYQKLADLAERDASHKKFYEPIQTRLAELYLIDKQPAKAAAVYQNRLVRDPTSADAIYNLGLIYEQEGRWEDAFSTWSTFARGLTPGSSSWFDARYRTARALSRLAKKKDACEVITVTQSLHPDLQDEDLKARFAQLRDEVCTDGQH